MKTHRKVFKALLTLILEFVLQKKKYPFSLSVLLLCVSCYSQGDTRINEINDVLENLHFNERFNGNILIAEKGKIIYEKSFGYADLEKGNILNKNSIFNIASVSKVFTVSGIMLLEEEAKLNLNDKVTKYLPGFPHKNVTIKNLLTHSSGLIRMQSQPFRKLIEGKGYSNSQIKDTYIDSAPDLHFEAGTNYFYSNTNYMFLALIIEHVSNQDFNQFLKERIFEKAEMNETFLRKKRVPKENNNRIVSNYVRSKWLSIDFQNVDNLDTKISDDLTFGNDYGASSIYTTTRDLFKFHTALQNGILLKTESLEKMYSPNYLYSNKGYTVDSKSNYPSLRALGWCVAKDNSNIVYHAGGIIGARSFFIRNLEKDQCIIILTNNQEMNRYNFTFPMKILNQQNYKLDPISLPREFCTEYLKNGIDSAVIFYQKNIDNTKYKPFVDFDFEEIGSELIDKKDSKATIEVSKLYVKAFSDEFSWELLGNAFLLDNNVEEAKKSLTKSLEINPNHEGALETLKRINDK